MKLFSLNLGGRGGGERLKTPQNWQTEQEIAENKQDLFEIRMDEIATELKERLLTFKGQKDGVPVEGSSAYFSVCEQISSLDSREALRRLVEINFDIKLHNSVPALVHQKVIEMLDKRGGGLTVDLVNSALLEVKKKAGK